MIKKKNSILIMTLAIIMTCSGCSLFPDGTVNGIENGSLDIQDLKSDHITGQLSDNFIIDADVISSNDDTSWKQITAVNRNTTFEAVKKGVELLSRGEVLKEMEDLSKNEFPNYVYKYEDGSIFSDYGEGIAYFSERTNSIRYYNYISGAVNGLWNNKETAFPMDELDGFSLEEAETQARNTFKELGIELSEIKPQVYVMDVENMTKLMLTREDLHYYKPKMEYLNPEAWTEITWDKEDEVYYMIFNMKMDDKLLSEVEFYTDSKVSGGTKIQIAVSRSGVEYVSAQKLYQVKDKKELEGALCSVEEALDIVASTYQYMDTVAKMTVTDIKLEYVPILTVTGTLTGYEEYITRPYWIFTLRYPRNVTEKDGTEVEAIVKSSCLVDAVSKTVYKGKPKA